MDSYDNSNNFLIFSSLSYLKFHIMMEYTNRKNHYNIGWRETRSQWLVKRRVGSFDLCSNAIHEKGADYVKAADNNRFIDVRAF